MMENIDNDKNILPGDTIIKNSDQEQSLNNEETSENTVPRLQTRPLIKRLYEKSGDERKKSTSNVLNLSNTDSNKSSEIVVNFPLVECKVEPVEEAPESSSVGDTDNNNENIRLGIKTEWEDFEANIKEEPSDYHSSDDESQQFDDEDPDYGVISPPKKSKPAPKARKRKTKKKPTKELEDSSDQSPVKEWEVELDIPQEIKIGVPDRRRTVKLISEEEASSSCVVPAQATTSAAVQRKYPRTELALSDSESDVDFIDEFTDSDSDAYTDSDDDELQTPACSIKWTYELSTPLKQIPFTKQQGLLFNVENKNPMDFFGLFVDDNFLLSTLKQINSNIIKLKEKYSGLKDAEKVTLFEYRTFLAVLFKLGIIRIQELDMYWREANGMLDFPWFREQITYERFILILHCLEYADSEHVSSSEDALSTMRPIIDYFNNKMQEVYYPGKELILNQSYLISRRCLLSRDFLNRRLKKYGLKLYHLTEPNGLNLKLAVTTIGASNFNETPTTNAVAKYLLKDHLNAGHAVYMHYHFSSVDLAQYFLQNDTYCTGMLCKNRENNPVDVTLAKLTKRQYKRQYSDGLTVGKYSDILFISTEFDGRIVSTANKRGVPKNSPDAVVNFMKYVATIDRSERLFSCYPCARNRLPWKVKVFIHVLEMLMINAYLLFKKHVRNVEYYEFRLKIIDKLNAEKRVQRPMRGNENNVI